MAVPIKNRFINEKSHLPGMRRESGFSIEACVFY
jgi:hypothetical protein